MGARQRVALARCRHGERRRPAGQSLRADVSVTPHAAAATGGRHDAGAPRRRDKRARTPVSLSFGSLLRSLLRRPCRFSEIGAYSGLVSDRALSVRLGELEARGIIERRVDSEAKPVRIDYALTPKDPALEPIVRATARWADTWLGD